MVKRRASIRTTVCLSILAFLLLSLMVHYTSDIFPAIHQGAIGGVQSRALDGYSIDTDAQISHPLHSTLMLAEQVALGILIGLTYALIAAPSANKFPSFPPPDRPPISARNSH